MTENLENIIYIENVKNEILDIYKKNRCIRLHLNTLENVIKILLKYIDDRKCKIHLRKLIISSILYQMSSDQYVESNLNWSEYNILNIMILEQLNEIENDIYEYYYKNSFCYKYFGCKI